MHYIIYLVTNFNPWGVRVRQTIKEEQTRKKSRAKDALVLWIGGGGWGGVKTELDFYSICTIISLEFSWASKYISELDLY